MRKKQAQEAQYKNCEFDWCDGQCHWIIMRDDGQAIFKGVYLTKDQAEAEVTFQNISGYHLEHRKNSVKKGSLE